MSLFFANPRDITNTTITLTDPEDVKHLRKVLRAKVGERYTIGDGVAYSYEGEILDIAEEEITFAVLDKRPIAGESPLLIDVYQGMPKHGKMDVIVQKTVELGVRTIYPVMMDRTVGKVPKDKAKWITRWQKIAKGAAKQSERGYIPKVKDVIDTAELMAAMPDYDLVLFLDAGADGLTIKDVLNVHFLGSGAKVALIVGPEGGFSDEEKQDFSAPENAHRVRMGPRILRTETAAVAALAMLLYHYELG